MRFSTAFTWMKAGKKVKCGGFLGYWMWDPLAKEVIIITKDNDQIPLKDTHDWDFTLGFINSDEWDFYVGPNDPRESEEAKLVAAQRTGE